MGILENKLSHDNVEKSMVKSNNYWKFSHNINNDQKSRILIIWDPNHWSNIIIHTDDQYITYLLHNANGLSILCTTVYVANDEIKRLKLWRYIAEQSSIFNLPWIVSGDFNAILSYRDRINFGLYSSMGEQNFIDCISSSNLIEPDFTGIYFTWRGGLKFSIHSKIDHVFVNTLWVNKFQFGVHFGNHSLSDHTPILIKL